MTDTATDAPGETDDAPPPAKASKLPLLIGLVLALAGGGGGFLAVQAGLLGGHETAETGDHDAPEPDPLAPVAFVPLDPVVIALQGTQGREHLRFTAQLEVPPDQAEAVRAILPRIVDVLNGYLRTVDLVDLEDPSALTRLRAQMLRRIQVVAGEGRVNDLLIMEFVLN